MIEFKPVTSPASLEDEERLLDFIQSYYTYDHIAYDREALRPGLRALIQDPSIGQVGWLLHEQKTVGYSLYTYGFDLEFGGRFALITDLWIEPEHRGRGLGIAALRVIEERCLSQGVKALELQVEEDNLEAQGLYRKFGFERLTRLPMSKRI